MKRHVALVGFMGAGKSTIGRKLARELGCAFFDTDDLIVRAHGTIPEIFSREGEDAFRRYEREAIGQVLSTGDAGVVALGGGALTLAENRAFVKECAHRVFLRSSPEQILRRLRRSRERRPLLGAHPTLAQIRELYGTRMAHYADADYIVAAERLSDRAILDEILQWLSEKKIAL
ncbi:MAG TPA: shikimate kinase [Candidatus Cybelea sp.]|nr:shikimate kinase [Candidatus Cybelea sp.]